ncbi:MAG: hypothetical protein E7265_02725 [Lachnospiraceae bacterium]|nr:hypothetical protein [Lachnospiraceae bacterium]
MDRKYFLGYNGCPKEDLYVQRRNDCWHINAGVNSIGHTPGYGVCCDIADDSLEARDLSSFLLKTKPIQEFIIQNKFVGTDRCTNIFIDIWNYIQNQ